MLKRILITGKSSYVGNAVAEYLAQFPDQFQVDRISLRSTDAEKIPFSNYDCVFHVAGIAHANTGKLTQAETALYYAINTDLAIKTASAAKRTGVKQFIHMSSMIVYGKAGGGRICPDTNPAPDSTYGDSKWRGEQGVAQLADPSFRVAIIRAPMIYGPGCKGNYRFLSRLACKSPVFPKVSNERSMLYIGDLCLFVRRIIEQAGSGIFFPQSKTYVNTSEMVACIAKAHHQNISLLGCLAPMVSLVMHMPGKLGNLACKAFGSQTYAQEMSRYEGLEYQCTDFETSIMLTESEGKDAC